MADGFHGPNSRKPDIVEGAKRAARGRSHSATGRIRKETGRIFQRVEGRGMIDIQCGQPGRLHVKSLEPPRTGSGRSTAGRREINSVTAPYHEGMGKLKCKSKPWLYGMIESVVIGAVLGVGKNLHTLQATEIS